MCGSDLVFSSEDLFAALGLSPLVWLSDNDIQRTQKNGVVLRITRKRLNIEGQSTILVQVQDLSIENRQLISLHQYTSDLLVQVRSRITPIQNALTLFLDYPDSLSREDLQGLFGISAQELWQMERWLDSLRDISLLNSGSLEDRFQPETLNLGEVIQNTLRQINHMMNHPKKVFQVDCQVSPDIHVLADRPRLLRIFEGLLINALTYCERTPSIRIVAENEDGLVRFAITDNGIGITTEEQPHIFEYGFRSNHAIVRAGSGLGMDLWLSRSLLNRMGATMDFSSTVGSGSTFVITFRRNTNG